MNINDRVKGIKVLRLDKDGKDVEKKSPGDRIRLSVFITSPTDSHHIEFPEGVGRGELSSLLYELADSIANGV